MKLTAVILASAGAIALAEPSKHCPKNCVADLEQVCQQVEGVLEAIPLLPEPILALVGQAICFPKDVKPGKDSLCPKKCRNDDLKKACYYVDSLLLDSNVPTFVRNVTDNALCAIGELIPQGKDLLSAVEAGNDEHNKHCPANCAEKLAPVCDQVVNVIDTLPMVPDYVSDIVGNAICFPKDTKAHAGNLCPKDCGNAAKVCQYVDQILQAVPQAPLYVRNVTDHMICAVAEHIPAEKVNNLRSSFSLE